jgi:carbon storage regulator
VRGGGIDGNTFADRAAAATLTFVHSSRYIHFEHSFPQAERRLFMLVLSRKQNERIRVGDSVVVTVVRVSGDKVRIGIEAPPDVRVLRDELEDGPGMRTVMLDAAADLPIPRLFGFVG